MENNFDNIFCLFLQSKCFHLSSMAPELILSSGSGYCLLIYVLTHVLCGFPMGSLFSLYHLKYMRVGGVAMLNLPLGVL